MAITAVISKLRAVSFIFINVYISIVLVTLYLILIFSFNILKMIINVVTLKIVVCIIALLLILLLFQLIIYFDLTEFRAISLAFVDLTFIWQRTSKTIEIRTRCNLLVIFLIKIVFVLRIEVLYLHVETIMMLTCKSLMT